jgi:hypothetical protein
VDDLWDQFEGHYTVYSCVERVLLYETLRTGKTPETVRMSLDFYRYLRAEMDALPQAGYLGSPVGFTDVVVNTAAGLVHIVPDRSVPRDSVFEIDYYDD